MEPFVFTEKHELFFGFVAITANRSFSSSAPLIVIISFNSSIGEGTKTLSLP